MSRPSQDVKSVFDQAAEIDSPTERQVFLDQACAGQPELRKQVESLLQSFQEAGSFLETPLVSPLLPLTGPFDASHTPPLDSNALPSTTADTTPRDVEEEEKVGSWIGSYLLVKELGEGGMGTVFLAEEKGALRRTVALKVVKAGMDSAQVLARFQAEQQALTRMDHPNIARVFTAGTTARKRPYFVMEYAPGEPLTRYCDRYQLTLRERLRLFVQICDAVEHAHQKRILHRDLKPGNVLVVQPEGQQPQVKVIDFGLAKAIGQPLTDDSQLTQFGTLLGTPEYMAPEQADFHLPEIDYPADVYSLGVILFELLTGTTPMDQVMHPKEPILETLRRVREEEAPRPSQRVARLGERLEKIAKRRKVEPTRLAALLRGELDWIVLKALEKDPARRYRSAQGLGLDVQRYLNDERVEARPPSLGYRLSKFARKRRWTLTVAGAFALVLFAATINWAINRQRLAGQTQRADRAEEMIQDTIRTTQATVLKTLRYGRQLTPDDTTTLRNTAEVLGKVLRVPVASRRGRETLADVRITLAGIAAVLGDPREATSQFQTAIDELEQLVADPSGSPPLHSLARCYFDRAFFNQKAGKFKEAESDFLAAISRFEQMLRADEEQVLVRRDLAGALNNLAVQCRMTNRPTEAEQFCRQAAREAEIVLRSSDQIDERLVVASSNHNLGNLLRDRGEVQSALSHYGRAVEVLSPIDNPPADVAEILRNAYWDRANALGMLGRHDEATPDWKQAVRLAVEPTKDRLRTFQGASEAEERLNSQPTAAALFNAAVVQARAIPAARAEGEPTLEQRYSRRALQLLHQAAAKGYFRDPTHLQKFRSERAFTELPPAPFGEFLKELARGLQQP